MKLYEVASSLLASHDAQLRIYGVFSVFEMHDKGAPFADKVAGLLADPDPTVRSFAITVLAKAIQKAGYLSKTWRRR